MQTKNKIIFDKIEVFLNNVNFTRINHIQGKYEISSNDIIKVNDVDENGFNLLATRNLFFLPKGLFKISVKFDIVCKFSPVSRRHFAGDLKEIGKFIKKRKIEIFEDLGVGKKMSIIISQLTSINNNNPIVLPPNFLQNITETKKGI